MHSPLNAFLYFKYLHYILHQRWRFLQDFQVSFRARKMLDTVAFPLHRDIHFPSKAEVHLQLIYNMGALKKTSYFPYQIALGCLYVWVRRLEVPVNITLLAQRCLPLQQHCLLLRQRSKKKNIREWITKALLYVCVEKEYGTQYWPFPFQPMKIGMWPSTVSKSNTAGIALIGHFQTLRDWKRDHMRAKFKVWKSKQADFALIRYRKTHLEWVWPALRLV